MLSYHRYLWTHAPQQMDRQMDFLTAIKMTLFAYNVEENGALWHITQMCGYVNLSWNIKRINYIQRTILLVMLILLRGLDVLSHFIGIGKSRFRTIFALNGIWFIFMRLRIFICIPTYQPSDEWRLISIYRQLKTNPYVGASSKGKPTMHWFCDIRFYST